MINVAVLGAQGRMGAQVVKSVEADSGMSLIAALDLGDSLEQLIGSGTHVVVDFTTPDAVMSNLDFLINNGMNVVVGATSDQRGASLVFGVAEHALRAVLGQKTGVKIDRFYRR